MTWIPTEQPNQKDLAERFRQLMTTGPILRMPGAYDGIGALLAKKVGFQALYLSGAAYTASRGLPDMGLVYSNELAERSRDLIRASELPVLVDIDTGFGGVLNVARTGKEMVEAGVAAVQMEDQQLPKKCGHLNGKTLVSPEEMAYKIRTLKQVAPTLVVVARTDARSVEGLQSAIDRAHQYVAAGADAVFPEALTHEQEFRQFAQVIEAPLLANMTEFGKTPYYSASQFADWGFRMVIYPVTSLRIAARAVEQAYRELAKTGSQQNLLPTMQTRSELYDLIQYRNYEDLDERIAKTILPTLGES